jgi:5-(aminomethyl)-3-furanmethanol phosphate kinase
MMPKYRTWVVKLGGAMMHADEMLDWLQTCNATSEPVHCVIVLGGGTFADEVRHLQRQWLFPDAAAHELAIDAMRLNAQIVSTLLPTAARFSELAPLLRPKSANPCSIWLPRGHSSALGLPPSWDVSADSIALRAAQLLEAELLVLVKSVPQRDLQGTALELSAAGIIDRYFPTLMHSAAVPVAVMAKSELREFARMRGDGLVPPEPLETG